MIRVLLLSFVMFFSSLGFTQIEDQVDTKDLNVGVGIDQIIDLDFEFDPKMNLGDDSLVKVKVDLNRKKITVIGIKEGNTSLTIKDSEGDEKIRYAISVTQDDQTKTVSQLREFLEDIEGLEIGIKGGKVFVGGYIVKPNDIGVVSSVLGSYPGVLRLIEMHPQTQEIIAKKMTEEFQKFNLKDLSVRVVNQSYWVEGVIGSEGEKNLAEQVARAFLPDKITGLSANSDRTQTNSARGSVIFFLSVNEDKKKKDKPLPKQLKISSQFVELSKDYSKIFGFKWAPTLSNNGGSIAINGSDGGVSTNSSAFSAVINNLFPKMQSLKNAGYGRVIQSGMFITEDKKSGTVSKNTQIPFSVGTGEAARSATASITFNMQVTPEILPKENVKMAANIQVSMPNGTSGNGSPVVTNNSINTNVYVRSGQSAVIGGIVQSEDVTGYDKNDPAAYDEDTQREVFFNLLKSKSRSLSKSQYVVFITPEIIESAAQDTAEIKRKFRRVRR